MTGRPAAMVAGSIVVLAACVAYATTLQNYFVQDDFGVVALLSQKPALYFPHWFASTWMDQIWGYTPDEVRPFPAVSYQLTALWGATSTTANHVLNIGLHAANGLIVLALGLGAAALSVPAATLAALAFVLMPVQAESVAWITGRVDSMPAFFYLASFLAWTRWRARGGAIAYAWSLALFFVALFSKQNTITMVPALVLYDWMVGRWVGGAKAPPNEKIRDPSAGRGFSPADLIPHVPFIVLTVGYLALRYLLFGAVVREDQLTAQSQDLFVTLVVRHMRRLVFGSAQAVGGIYWAVPAVAAAAVAVIASISAIDRRRVARVACYVGIVWIALGVAPVAVAGYDSPRHIYLASVGWALVLGLAFDIVWCARPVRFWRVVAALAAAALFSRDAVQLATEVRTWNTRARVSQLAAADLDRALATAPAGSLVIAGAPKRSWEWAIPFVARPPYARTDWTKQVVLVSPWFLHCCRSDWETYTRAALKTWTAGKGDHPMIVLYWDEASGDLSRLTDAEEPYLRALVPVLLGTDNHESLNEGIMDMLTQLVEPHKVAR